MGAMMGFRFWTRTAASGTPGAALVASVWCLLCLRTLSAADTHYVSPTGTDEYPYLTSETAARSIQAAIDAADAGDMIDVAPGDYVEPLTMKPRQILSGAGPSATRIGGFVFAPEDVVIRDATVVGEEGRGGIVPGPFGGQRIDNCIISGPLGVGISHGAGSPYMPITPIIISRSTIRDADVGLRLRDTAQPVVLERCTISACQTGIACYWGEGTLSLNHCSITDNFNGMYLNGNWELDMYASSVNRNSYSGVHVADGVSLSVSYSTICCNGLRGIYADGAYVDVVNCTVSGNDWGVVHEATVLSLRNSIVWGNASVDLFGLEDGGVAAYCNIGGGFPGEGNFDGDPLFRGPQNCDFRLGPGSPCIDAGHRRRTDPDVDKDGRPTGVYGGKQAQRVDIGAYEYHISEARRDPRTQQVTVTWSSLPGRTYSLFYSDDVTAWHLADNNVSSAGDVTTSWTDDGSVTGIPPVLASRRFYRVLENP